MRNSEKFLFNICILLTVLSQIQEYSYIVKPIMYFMWLVLLFKTVSSHSFVIRVTPYLKFFIITTLIIVLESLIGLIFSNGDYNTVNTLRLLLLPLFVYLQSSMMVINDFDDIKMITVFYCLSASILCFYVYINYIPSISTWLNTSTYLYAAKNAAGQILCSSFILLFVLGKSKNKQSTIIKLAYIVFVVLACIFLQCRTALLGLIISITIYVLSLRKKRKWKIAYMVFALVALIVVLFNERLLLIARHAIGLDKYDVYSFDSLSSGRGKAYLLALDAIKSHWIMGVGDYYVDNYYLLSIASLGIIGGIPLIVIVIGRFSINIKKYFENPSNIIVKVSMTLSIFYFIESLLEGYPPLGPGACSFIFWFFCGLTDSNLRLNSKSE